MALRVDQVMSFGASGHAEHSFAFQYGSMPMNCDIQHISLSSAEEKESEILDAVCSFFTHGKLLSHHWCQAHLPVFSFYIAHIKKILAESL